MRVAVRIGWLGLLLALTPALAAPPAQPELDAIMPPLKAPIVPRQDGPPTQLPNTQSAPAAPPTPPPPAPPGERPLPINLATALHLAGARPLDVALAAEQVRVASARLDQAHVLWLPTIYVGADYFRHDGRIQDIQG